MSMGGEEMRSASGQRQWQVLRGWLLAQIDRGSLQPGERAPSLRTLARKFNVSIATAQRAVDELVNEGFVRPVPRSGYIVNSLHSRIVLEDDQARRHGPSQNSVKDMAEHRPLTGVHLGMDAISGELGAGILLNRCLSAIARDQRSSSTLVELPGVYEFRRRVAGLMNRRHVDRSEEHT